MTSEEPEYSVQVSAHNVEKGGKVTDHIQREGVTLNIQGLLLGDQASQSRYRIVKAMEKGQMLQYIGRTMLTNCIITAFRTSHDNSISNGMSFSLTLKQIHIATKKRMKTSKKSSNNPSTQKQGNGGSKQVTHPHSPFNHLVRRGQTWETIAQYYGYKPHQLREWNKQYAQVQEWDKKYKQVEEGMVLSIGAPAPAPKPSAKKYKGPNPTVVGVLTHEVKRGETWDTIAAMYGISTTVLKARNRYYSEYRSLQPGMILGIA
ncbi:LysM peptidoglycan-binding domain-containing protein [Paenibacillus assamensis]|uniref:LysM peptidoglycan-binding domain-containing protein n=1 Tax=Paenibacillus assamensis TaxID=311244 RepID=UPI00042356B3|nr:LysM domain-containing protein [Paenibacillus assamensis]